MTWASPEAKKEYEREYRRTHRDAIRANGKRWRQRHPEKELERHREQYVATRKTAYWRRLLSQAKKRAAKKNFSFELTPAWALARWTGKCEETGLEFHTGANRHPRSPSIDRIDNSKGYTQENSRFVVWGFNAAKCCGTDEDVLVMAKALVANRG